MPVSGGAGEELPLRAFVFITGDAEFIARYAPTVEPAANETCLFVQLPSDATTTNGLTVSGAIGRDLRALIASATSGGVPSWLRSAVPALLGALSDAEVRALGETGTVAWTGTDTAVGLLQLFGFANAELQPIAQLLASLAGDSDADSATDTFFGQFESLLVARVREVLALGSGEGGAVSFVEASSRFLDDLRAEFSWFFDYLPQTAAGEAALVEQVLAKLANSRVLKFAAARDAFLASLTGSLLDTESLGSVFSANLAALQARQRQIFDIAAAGAVVGSVAFTVGTVYQIIYDIIDAFVQIIRYAGAGIGYLYGAAKDALIASATEPDEALAPASNETVLSLFSGFDVEAFLTTDLPMLIADLRTTALGIVDDFIENAERYGEAVAEFLTRVLGQGAETTLNVLFDAYDESASALDRMLYAVKQWFSLGTMLGPMIVDIVLMFCSGGSSGVVSAATKLGKLDAVGDALAFTRRAAGAIERLPVYDRVVSFVNRTPRLRTTIARLFEALWNAVGAVADRVKQLLAVLYKAPEPDWPPLEDVAVMVDTWYDRCSTVNFFAGILVMLSGSADVDTDGNLVLADAG
jgi:hypothetical protein